MPTHILLSDSFISILTQTHRQLSFPRLNTLPQPAPLRLSLDRYRPNLRSCSSCLQDDQP
uniref:Uncharacterized protein n=1 Tax=Octopus bimaculoides TaxID=37653 RepID=A0A0L8FG04_OCTBM